MYFTPDGRSAVIVAEAYKRLDFRDPHTMALQSSLETPDCAGINHADFSIDGRYAIFTCEFSKGLAKIDFVDRKVVGYLKLSKGGMPSPSPAATSVKFFSSALSPASSAAGVAPSAASSLRTITWFRSRS